MLITHLLILITNFSLLFLNYSLFGGWGSEYAALDVTLDAPDENDADEIGGSTELKIKRKGFFIKKGNKNHSCGH